MIKSTSQSKEQISIESTASIQVSYYFLRKEYNTIGNYPFWPAFACFILLGASALFTGGSNLTVFLLFFSAFAGLFCAVVTRFHANAILMVTENGFEIIRKNKKVYYPWSEISHVSFLTRRPGLSYLEVILTIYKKSNDVDYVFIDSLRFKTASSRAKTIGSAIEKRINNYIFTIQKSDFEPILLDRKYGPPNILS